MAEQQRQKPPAVAKGKRVEVGLDRRVINAIKPQGTFKGLGDTLIDDILRPNIQGLMLQLWHSIGDYVLGGRGYSGRTYNSYRSSSYDDEPSYRYGGRTARRNYSSARRQPVERKERRYDDTKYDIIPTEQDVEEGKSAYMKADEVKTNIEDWVEKYHSITISEVNAFVGFEDQDHTDCEWGWYDVSGMRIHSVNYNLAQLIMPRPEPVSD